MTDRPTDRDLDRALAELPREAASPGFSRRVLADLETGPRPRAGGRWLLAATATAAVLAVGLWLLPPAGREPPRVETRALEEEHRLLMQELESLKASLRASQEAPVLYLGGNENVDLVLDLEPVWRAGTKGLVRAAAYDGSERPVTAIERPRGDGR